MNNTNSQHSTQGVVYESEAQRLQREADSFTKKYEHEKKHFMVLTDQEKELREQLKEKREQVKIVRPTTARMRKDQHEIKLLENKCEQALTKYNELQSENKALRNQVDMWRKQLRNQQRVNKGYTREISKTIEEIKKLNQQTYNGQRFCQDTNDQILALKAKHEIDKFTFEHKILDLQEKLQEKDDTELESTKTKGLEIKDSSNTAEFANPIALLKPRLNKWQVNNREKRALMDMYTRNVEVIEHAFQQIEKATGVSSVEEIVTTFIKAEEQNYSLYNYVNMLNSDIDTVEEQNKQIGEEIKHHLKLQSMSQADKQVAREQILKETQELKVSNELKEQQISGIETQMAQIKDFVQSMCQKFRSSQFMLSVAAKMSYDEGTQFNENNVTQYLAELEEYVSHFITFMAQREKNPDAPISALSLDTMTNKEFEKGPLNIDNIPNSNNFNNNFEDDQTQDDEIITNKKDLYRKFAEFASKGYIDNLHSKK